MKFKHIIALLIASCIIGTLAHNSDTYVNDNQILDLDYLEQYKKNIANFKLTSVEDIYYNMQNNNSFYIYIGRATCEWCRLFVPTLAEYAYKNQIEVYYLDSSETETDMMVKSFRVLNEIDFVPTLLYYSKESNIRKVNFNLTSTDFDVATLEAAIIEMQER